MHRRQQNVDTYQRWAHQTAFCTSSEIYLQRSVTKNMQKTCSSFSEETFLQLLDHMSPNKQQKKTQHACPLIFTPSLSLCRKLHRDQRFSLSLSHWHAPSFYPLAQPTHKHTPTHTQSTQHKHALKSTFKKMWLSSYLPAFMGKLVRPFGFQLFLCHPPKHQTPAVFTKTQTLLMNSKTVARCQSSLCSNSLSEFMHAMCNYRAHQCFGHYASVEPSGTCVEHVSRWVVCDSKRVMKISHC